MPPSGNQYTIAAGQYAATVAEAGATIRALTHQGTPVLDGFPETAICDSARGQVLAPWPNRVAAGAYSFDGERRQLDLTEPAAGNAIHGLVRWDRWMIESVVADAVTLRHRLLPRPGYPHVLDLRISYALDAEGGLRVEVVATNAGDRAAPWGIGHHPYLKPGDVGTIRDCTLRLRARRYLDTDGRGIPVRDVEPAGTPYDFTSGRIIGDEPLDHAYGDLARDADGSARVALEAPDRGSVSVWLGAAYRWVQVFTGHTLAPARRFAALAIEPMSCPPNAFVTGRDLVYLEPGESWTGEWGVRHAPAPS